MSVQSTIENKLNEALKPAFLEVVNESHQHAGHAHGSTDSHFKAVIVSSAFDGVGMVARHQHVYKILAEMMNNPIHALVLKTYTAEEWQKQQG
ncbi:Cell division protein BolA [gamma proteobacterium IMCC2047]|nr:Cell division protein BolA [gamma proteobacterium IMCC2047]